LSSIRDADESYEDQIKATESHIKFIKSLPCDVDVYISTYKSKFEDKLKEIYSSGSNLIRYDSRENLETLTPLILDSLKNINLENYNFLFILRIDLFLKDKFSKVFNPNWNTIMFPSICFRPHNITSSGHPRINDMMMFFPKKYFKYTQYIHYRSTAHEQWGDFMESTDLEYKDMDTMLTTYHDSDSFKDLNPIYDSLSECILEIEELKNELTTIVMTQTSTGPNARDRWDTPEIKLQQGKKGRLRKDRYSSLLIANMLARQIKRSLQPIEYEVIGGNLKNVVDNKGQLYKGPAWFTQEVNDDIYKGIYRQ
jgi:hypothetical protein